MKKFLISFVGLALLAGCTYYDYYKAGVRYTQDGDDCIYYVAESGRDYTSRIDGLDNNEKIVYRNTKCADLYARDNDGRIPARQNAVFVPSTTYVDGSYDNAYPSCGCKKCGAPAKYVLVPATR